MRPWIGLIEDSESRVAWLQDVVGDAYEVVHGPRVSTWTAKLSAAVKRGQPALMVYDHDLGMGSFEDVDGNNGFDALVRSSAIVQTPRVLIWSTNDDARSRMRTWACNTDPGALVKTMPFSHENLSRIKAWLGCQLRLPAWSPAPGLHVWESC